MIHQVAIKSLPQEWLWCETWCDDASKKSAKTIDLVSINMYINYFVKKKYFFNNYKSNFSATTH
jgi:hypothetical protein